MSKLSLSLNFDNDYDTHVIARVQELNRYIKILVFEIFDALSSAGFDLRPRDPLRLPGSNNRFLKFFIESDLCDDHRWKIAEAIVCDMICSVVHEHYFEGEFFMGLGSSENRDYLEKMLRILTAMRKSFFLFFIFFIFRSTLFFTGTKQIFITRPNASGASGTLA
jgi:hypothetical protein